MSETKALTCYTLHFQVSNKQLPYKGIHFFTKTFTITINV